MENKGRILFLLFWKVRWGKVSESIHVGAAIGVWDVDRDTPGSCWRDMRKPALKAEKNMLFCEDEKWESRKQKGVIFAHAV